MNWRRLYRVALMIFILSTCLFIMTSAALAAMPAVRAAALQDAPEVVPFVDFLNAILAAVQQTLLGSSVASGALVMSLVDLLKLIPLPAIQDPNDPHYLSGLTLQNIVGGILVVIFWIAPVVGISDAVNRGFDFATQIVPLLVQMLVLAIGTFGWSWAAHAALSKTSLPIVGKRSVRT